MSSNTDTTRRFFLGAATALAATRVWGANDKINVALVGLGGRGTSHLNIYTRLPEAHLSAICDIDQAARALARRNSMDHRTRWTMGCEPAGPFNAGSR